MAAVVEVKVVPMGTIVPSISSYVKACYNLVKDDPEVDSELTPTSTILAGDLDHILNLVRAMHRVPFGHGVDRVLTQITIDERTDKDHSIDEMVAAVFEDLPD
ncbi:MAG: MTH1187 family thiamine-binding protein [Firmicutes bacterium]|nr:MTH1187 family thiamine-binding protein [Alicyclobacillaceae bacterium]MCL6497271.1 MTH1187 family thiamine-binding protein [Bacillota bacterium]